MPVVIGVEDARGRRDARRPRLIEWPPPLQQQEKPLLRLSRRTQMRHGGDTGGAAARLPDTAPLASVASSGGVEVPLSALAADGGPLPHWHRTLPGEERSSLICFRLSRNAPNFLYRSGGPDGAPRAEVALRWGRRTGVGGARTPAACGVGR